MTAPVHIRLARPPAVWASYPGVLLRRRPTVTKVAEPPEFVATLPAQRIDGQAAARYARMCGFESGAGVPITYPHVLAMPLHLRIFAHPAFPLRPMGLIHLSNVIEAPGSLEAGATVDIAVAARNYRRTDAGLCFDMATELRAGDRPLWRETCVFLSRWPEPAERTGGRPPRPPRAPRDSELLGELTVSLETAWAYARVSADYNPIHLSDRAARYFGLRGSIAHGMWSLARSLAQRPLADVPAGARIDTQFLSPVQLPARVAVKTWTDGAQKKRALCDVRTGRVHMIAEWSGLTRA